MPDIGPGECSASITGAIFTDGREVFVELAIVDIEFPVPGKKLTVPCVPGRNDTVKQINTS